MHRRGREILVAACDADLVGRSFEEGELRLLVAEAFYGGADDHVSEHFLLLQLRTCTMANLVGERVVAMAVRSGFVKAANVLKIAGVPHAQLVAL